LALAQRALEAVDGAIPPRLRTPLRYAEPVVLVGLTAFFQHAVHPEPGLAPFELFFLTVAVVSFLGGRGPGLTAVALSAATGNYLFLPPLHGWSFGIPAVFTTGLFAVSASTVSVLAALFRDALLEAARSATTIQEQLRMLATAKRALEESEAASRAQSREFSEILEVVPAPIWIAHDREGRTLTGNRAANEVAGVPAGANASLTPANGAAPAYRAVRSGRPLEEDELPVQRAARTGQRVTAAELEIVRPDGTRRHLLGDAIPLVDASGATRGAVGAFVDITERKRAEEALAKREEELRLVLDAAEAGSWDWDVAAGVLTWSPRSRELFEVPPDAEVTYERFLAALHPDDRGKIEERVRQALERGTEYEAEMRVPLPSGGIRWLVTRGRVHRDAEGRPVRIIGMALDVTRRKLVEEELRRADRVKSEFLGVLSHELRNPLAPLLNALYIVRRAEPGSEQAARALAVIERQARQLSRLTDDLLDVTRVARGKIRLECERVELRSLLQRVVEDHQPVFEAAGVRLELRAELHEPRFVYADPARLTQMFGNLLHNAAKFTPRGGWTQLRVRDAGEGQVAVQVADSGAGLRHELRERLFEPFVQGDDTLGRAGGGLGLGLALVKGLAQIQGGEVTAESEGPGRGSTFTVRLPLDRRRAARLALVSAAPARQAGLHVLIVEDNVDAASTLREALQLEGHRVEVARAGPEGVAAARAWRPDVVVCDLGLPGMTGLDVARELRADPALRDVRLIALSGYANADDVERSIAAGFDVHLAKPPDIELLARSLRPDEGAAVPRGA
jgi:PAS domain S-box-containing protein